MYFWGKGCYRGVDVYRGSPCAGWQRNQRARNFLPFRM